MHECSGTDVVIDERLLLIGCGIEQDKFMFINLMIIFLEYAIYKVYLIEYYNNKKLTQSFIIREFKNEFQAYCSLLTTKLKIANLDREIRCVENWYNNYYVMKAETKGNNAV